MSRRRTALPQPGPEQAPLFADPPADLLLDGARRRVLRGSILLDGEEGIGKRRLAQEMARLLLCRQAGQEASPCDSCRRVLAGNHPDVQVMAPDGAVIRVEAARRVVEEAPRRPYEADRRVVIVDGADRLHLSAANALLKTLEEPPRHQLFILLTSRPQDVLPTIRSRAPAHHVPNPSHDATVDWLTSVGWKGDEAREAVSVAGPRPGFLLRGGHRGLAELRQQVVALLQGHAGGDGGSLFSLAELLAGEDEVGECCRLTASLLRDLAVATADGPRLRHEDLRREIEEIASNLDRGRVASAARRLLEVPGRLRTNPNRRLLFDDILQGLHSEN